MRRIIGAAILAASAVTTSAWLHAQGREWTTAAFDAQRTGWVRTDARLTMDAVKKGQFQFLWKARFENDARQLNSLTPPILLDRLIGYRGFKALGFIGGSSDRVFAVDTDLARPYWTTHLNYSAATGGQPASSWECPGGLIAMPTRRTVLAPQPPVAGGGGPRGGRSGSAVGEPGRGAAILTQQPAARGRGAAPAGPPPTPAVGGRAVAPIPFGGVDPLYAVGSDGYLHTISSANGADMTAPVPFLPPNTKPSALIFVDGVVYTTTSSGCGAAPNAVWAIDLTAENTVTSWNTGGADIIGTTGPAFGGDGTLYVALGNAPERGDRTYANAIVALDRATLQPKDWFSAPGVEFNAAPIVLRYKSAPDRVADAADDGRRDRRDLVAATADDGRMYLLDGASLGGADHKTPLHVTAKYTAPGARAGLATWESQGMLWILAPVAGAPQPGVKFAPNGVAPRGSIVAFKVSDEGNKLTLTPGWASRNLTSPLAPIIVNGLVFVASSGEYRGTGAQLTATQRAQRSTPAVLYVLDGTTGKQLWSSGTTITSFARGGLSAGSGQVYVVTYDNHLYAFGIPMEH
jgi:hypothetical protein